MSDGFRLIVGLGNPGPRYAETRHNAGFWFVDALASRERCAFREDRRSSSETASLAGRDPPVMLQKPLSFMNNSGLPVHQLAAFHKWRPEEILVVHDELDLSPGTLRLKRGGGHGGHNGLRDLIRHIGADFARLRVGIGHPGNRDDVVPYVLDTPRKTERESIDDALTEALGVVGFLLDGDWDRAVRTLHTRQAA